MPADGQLPLAPGVTEQRAALVDAVWSTAAVRQALLADALRTTPQRTRVAALSAMISAGAGLVGSLPFAGVVVVGVVGGLIGAAAGRRGRQVLLPASATTLPALPRYAAGRIQAANEIIAPGSGELCAAWAIELRVEGRWSARTTLRVGATAGLELVLDGGARVAVPAGPLWIAGDLAQLGDVEDSLEELLRAIDPLRADRHDPWPLFPFNVVVERAMHVGDRVEVLGELTPAVVAGGAAVLYRDAPSTVLAPVGVPTLRRG